MTRSTHLAALAALAVLALACRDPTQIQLEVTLAFDCADHARTRIGAGTIDDLDAREARVSTTACRDDRVGSITSDGGGWHVSGTATNPLHYDPSASFVPVGTAAFVISNLGGTVTAHTVDSPTAIRGNSTVASPTFVYLGGAVGGGLPGETMGPGGLDAYLVRFDTP